MLAPRPAARPLQERCPRATRRRALARGAVVLLAVLAGTAAFAQGSGRRDLRLGRVDASAAYVAAAEAWGFELVLEEALHPAELRVELDGVTRDEALDLLIVAADHFWWVGEERAIHVTRDTPNERRRVTAAVERTYRLERAQPAEVRSALYSFASHRVEAGEASVQAEVWAGREPHADAVVAAMEGDGPPGWSVRWLMSYTGFPVGAPEPRLGEGPRKRLWFSEPTPVERLQEAVEEAWDVDLVLDPAVLDPGVGSLRLEEASLFEALDALTVATGRFWTPVGGRRIVIAEEGSRRFDWEPMGFATLRLERADPATVQDVLRRLGVRTAFAGSSPPVLLVRDTPQMLAVARFVAEALDGRDPLGVPGLHRLWLGTLGRPRLAEAQLLVDPATAADRRRALATALPPELGPGSEPAPEAVPAGERGSLRPLPPERRQRPLRQVLERDLGLHAGLFPCCCDSALFRASVTPPADGGRAAFLDRFTTERSMVWGAIGPDAVVLAQDSRFGRSAVQPWGVVAVPMDLEQRMSLAVSGRLDALELEKSVHASGPRPLLFATGPWESLGALLAAGAAEPPVAEE